MKHNYKNIYLIVASLMLTTTQVTCQRIGIVPVICDSETGDTLLFLEKKYPKRTVLSKRSLYNVISIENTMHRQIFNPIKNLAIENFNEKTENFFEKVLRKKSNIKKHILDSPITNSDYELHILPINKKLVDESNIIKFSKKTRLSKCRWVNIKTKKERLSKQIIPLLDKIITTIKTSKKKTTRWHIYNIEEDEVDTMTTFNTDEDSRCYVFEPEETYQSDDPETDEDFTLDSQLPPTKVGGL